jgi:sec-independent protein translocase protein TatA
MHFPGLVPLLIVLFLAFLLFGRPGKLSGLMEDLGKGIKGFRKGLGDPETPPPAANDPPRQVPDQNAAPRTETSANGDRAQN